MLNKYLIMNKDHESDNDPNNEDEYNQNNFVMRSRENSAESNKEVLETSKVKKYIVENKDKHHVNFMPTKTVVKKAEIGEVNNTQEKLEKKSSKELDQVIKEKEKEIEYRVKKEFEEAINKLKDELQANLIEEKKRLEQELAKKWEDQYDNLVVECKSKLRGEKEKQLAKNMYNKLKPTVEKEIYKKEYTNVEQKIRGEIEHQIKDDVLLKKAEELEKARRKLDHYTKVTCEEMQKDIKTKFKDNFDQELSKEVEMREKELKVT
jgi:hypothetical protein